MGPHGWELPLAGDGKLVGGGLRRCVSAVCGSGSSEFYHAARRPSIRARREAVCGLPHCASCLGIEVPVRPTGCGAA
jgi:hypothetical protein